MWLDCDCPVWWHLTAQKDIAKLSCWKSHGEHGIDFDSFQNIYVHSLVSEILSFKNKFQNNFQNFRSISKKEGFILVSKPVLPGEVWWKRLPRTCSDSRYLSEENCCVKFIITILNQERFLLSLPSLLPSSLKKSGFLFEMYQFTVRQPIVDVAIYCIIGLNSVGRLN